MADLKEVLESLTGATKSLASRESRERYAGKYHAPRDDDDGGGGGGSSGGSSRYESGWTRELSEAEYTQRVEAARRSAEARRKEEAEVHRAATENMSPFEKARYAAQLETRARDKLAELENQLKGEQDPAKRAALEGQIQEIEAALRLADQWLDDQEDEDMEVLDREIRQEERKAERQAEAADRRLENAAERLREQAEQRQEQIEDEARTLERQAEKLDKQAELLAEQAAYRTSVVGQIMARNQAAQLSQKAGDLRELSEKRTERQEESYESFQKRAEERMQEMLREREQQQRESEKRIEQLKRARERRAEEYAEAREYLQRNREKERSSTSFFF